jgi:hypothetical protein
VFQLHTRIRWRRPVTTQCVLLKITADLSFRIHRHDMTFAIKFMKNSVQLPHSLKEIFYVCIWIRNLFKSLLARSAVHNDSSSIPSICFISQPVKLKREREVREEGWRPKKSRKCSSFIGAFQSVHCRPVSLSKQNIGSKTVKYIRYTHFGPIYNLVRTTCLRHMSRTSLGPTQPPVQWVLGLSRG